MRERERVSVWEREREFVFEKGIETKIYFKSLKNITTHDTQFCWKMKFIKILGSLRFGREVQKL